MDGQESQLPFLRSYLVVGSSAFRTTFNANQAFLFFGGQVANPISHTVLAHLKVSEIVLKRPLETQRKNEKKNNKKNVAYMRMALEKRIEKSRFRMHNMKFLYKQ